MTIRGRRLQGRDDLSSERSNPMEGRRCPNSNYSSPKDAIRRGRSATKGDEPTWPVRPRTEPKPDHGTVFSHRSPRIITGHSCTRPTHGQGDGRGEKIAGLAFDFGDVSSWGIRCRMPRDRYFDPALRTPDRASRGLSTDPAASGTVWANSNLSSESDTRETRFSDRPARRNGASLGKLIVPRPHALRSLSIG